jgi:hypothetical protein
VELGVLLPIRNKGVVSSLGQNPELVFHSCFAAERRPACPN